MTAYFKLCLAAFGMIGLGLGLSGCDPSALDDDIGVISAAEYEDMNSEELESLWNAIRREAELVEGELCQTLLATNQLSRVPEDTFFSHRDTSRCPSSCGIPLQPPGESGRECLDSYAVLLEDLRGRGLGVPTDQPTELTIEQSLQRLQSLQSQARRIETICLTRLIKQQDVPKAILTDPYSGKDSLLMGTGDIRPNPHGYIDHGVHIGPWATDMLLELLEDQSDTGRPYRGNRYEVPMIDRMMNLFALSGSEAVVRAEKTAAVSDVADAFLRLTYDREVGFSSALPEDERRQAILKWHEIVNAP